MSDKCSIDVRGVLTAMIFLFAIQPRPAVFCLHTGDIQIRCRFFTRFRHPVKNLLDVCMSKASLEGRSLLHMLPTPGQQYALPIPPRVDLLVRLGNLARRQAYPNQTEQQCGGVGLVRVRGVGMRIVASAAFQVPTLHTRRGQPWQLVLLLDCVGSH